MVENKLHLWDFGHADAVSTAGLSLTRDYCQCDATALLALQDDSRASMSGKVAGNVVNEENGSIQGAHGSR